MDYEWCRIKELARHAASGDAQAQAPLVEEIRRYLRDLVDRYGATRQTTADFAQQVLAQARRDYGDFWTGDSEFGSWIDGILQREVEEACRCA
jgi:DNA-directed RNA polymerase specialized sigma24 family protein